MNHPVTLPYVPVTTVPHLLICQVHLASEKVSPKEVFTVKFDLTKVHNGISQQLILIIFGISDLLDKCWW